MVLAFWDCGSACLIDQRHVPSDDHHQAHGDDCQNSFGIKIGFHSQFRIHETEKKGNLKPADISITLAWGRMCRKLLNMRVKSEHMQFRQPTPLNVGAAETRYQQKEPKHE